MNKTEKLIELKKHLDEGVIDVSEFELLKAEILGEEIVGNVTPVIEIKKEEPIKESQKTEIPIPKSDENQKISPHKNSYQTIEPEKNSNKTLYIVLGVILFLIVGAIFWYRLNSKPNQKELEAKAKAIQDSIVAFDTFKTESNISKSEDATEKKMPESLVTVKIENDSIDNTGNNQTSVTNQVFVIGQKYGGGIIFEIDNTGQHGLISAEYDVYAFNPHGTNWESAKKECEDYVEGDYDDWRLPTIDELKLMYYQHDKIGSFQKDNWSYWSSTEIYDSNTAKTCVMSSGQIDNMTKKSNSVLVRAVRNF